MSDMVKRISQIFADQVFHVPDYQRGYAWEKRQWDDLLEDLDLLPAGRTHFTGTLVLRSRNAGGGQIIDQHLHAYDDFDLVDGQQRLTTIVILLKTIHDEMQRYSQFNGLTGRLRETYLYHTDLNGQPFTKLTLNADSQDFFANNILGLHPGISGPTIRSHERLLGARDHFTAELERNQDELGDKYPNWLQQMYAKITLQLNLIVYPVEDELDAGTIFETMNDRGKPLTELEKVKNFLLYVSGKLDLPGQHDLNRRINLTWKSIYERLMATGLAARDAEDQLLRAHWLMAYNYDVSKWQNARSIKEYFSLRKYHDRHPELLQDLKAYLHSLQDATSAFCDIFKPMYPGAFNDITDTGTRSEIMLWGNKLTRLGVSASFLPLLMAVRARATEDGTAYLKTLQLLEKYSFRVFSWRRARSNAGQTTLFQLGNRYFQNPFTDWMHNEVAHLIVYYCPDETFNERFVRDAENWYNWQDINYFLYEYEHHLAGGRPVQLTWEALNARPKASSIEHILPQMPKSAYWRKHFSAKQRLRWTHDLGNLTLTFDNSSLSIKPFPDKKGAPGIKGTYADSPLFIERALSLFPDWNEAELLRRREALIAWAQERWKVEAEPRPPDQPKKMDDMFDLAEEYGLRAELEAIHAAATRLNMSPSVRQGIRYRHPRDHRMSTIVVYLRPNGLQINFYYEIFDQYPGVLIDDMADILQVNDGINWFSRDRIHKAVEALDRFYEYLQQKQT
jgi:hypothetical protein